MEKVKITREQAEAIEFGIKHHCKTDIVRAHTNVKGWNLTGELSPLNHLGLDKLIRALYIGYEVEPEFKVGDWVIFTAKPEDEPIFGRINKSMIVEWDDGVTNNYDEIQKLYKEGNLRHATPEEIAEEKERRWWKKHGKDVWELRKGDVLVDTDGEILEVTDKRDDSKGYYLDYCSYSLEMIKNRFIILTFAENRLDREDGNE